MADGNYLPAISIATWTVDALVWSRRCLHFQRLGAPMAWRLFIVD